MANDISITGGEAIISQPVIRKIGPKDLMDALARGYDDFKNKPSHILFLFVIYPIVVFFLIRLSAGYETLPLVFPLVAGYALIGPVTAIGLYEMSRRREMGLDVSWRHAFEVVRSPAIGAIVQVSSVLAAVFVAWLLAALWIYDMTFGGMVPTSILDFITQVFTTPEGWTLIVVGNSVGFLFAVVAFTIGVVSFPLLLDRNVGSLEAIRTSFRAVVANPVTMALWGFIVASALLLGALPFFVGLAIVWPVLGHATWHLYRKVVEH
jgi:uncharacterized membrane protein